METNLSSRIVSFEQLFTDLNESNVTTNLRAADIDALRGELRKMRHAAKRMELQIDRVRDATLVRDLRHNLCFDAKGDQSVVPFPIVAREIPLPTGSNQPKGAA